MSKPKAHPTIFVKDGPAIRMMPAYHNENILDHVPAKIYQVAIDDKGEFLYPVRLQFTIPEKVYGDHKSRKKVIIEDYKKNAKKGPIGVLMTGEKGTGKSLLAEDLSNHFLTLGLPVIWVESAIPAKVLRSVIRQIGKCVVFFEEFSKIYPEKSIVVPDQQELLTLFSDRGLSEVVFLVVENTSKDISKYLHLRPQRFKWHFEFPKPGYEMFSEILGKHKLPPLIYNYFRKYFEQGDQSNDVYGIDVFETLVDVAKESKDLSEAMNKIKYLNVPHYLAINTSWELPVPGYATADVTMKNSAGEVIQYASVTDEYVTVEFDMVNQDAWEGTRKINLKVLLLGSDMLDAASSGALGENIVAAKFRIGNSPVPKIGSISATSFLRYNAPKSKSNEDEDDEN